LRDHFFLSSTYILLHKVDRTATRHIQPILRRHHCPYLHSFQCLHYRWRRLHALPHNRVASCGESRVLICCTIEAHRAEVTRSRASMQDAPLNTNGFHGYNWMFGLTCLRMLTNRSTSPFLASSKRSSSCKLLAASRMRSIAVSVTLPSETRL
jgi:hypothetical protein